MEGIHTGVLRVPRAGWEGNPVFSSWGVPRGTGCWGTTALRGTQGSPLQSWVRVSASPALTDTPDIHVQGTLAFGRPTNLTCAVPWACERGTPPTFSWTGVALTSLHPESPHSSVLTLTLQPQDHGTNLTCRVTFPGAGVSTYVTIRLNVSCEWGWRGKRLGPQQCWGEGGRAWAAGTGEDG